MRECKTLALGELATLIMGQSPPFDSINSDERGLPFLQGCAEFGLVSPEAKVYCSPVLRLAHAGATLISVRAPVGTMNLADQDYGIGRGLAAVLAKASVADNTFLRHAIAHGSAYLHRRSQGSTFLAISSDDLRSMPIPAFDQPSQKRIAEILSTLDEAIAQTEALIAKTQAIKAGLMHDLFTRGVTANGELRPPREEAPQLYKASLLGWIPEEWEPGKLSEKRASSRPHLKTGPFGSSLKLEHWVEHGRPVITIGALAEGRFVESELLHVSEATAKSLLEYQLEIGDVVFSRVADVGRSAVIRAAQKGWIMSSNLMRISLDSNLVNPTFLQAQLSYDEGVRRQIRAAVNAGGRDVANSQTLNRLLFAWPTIGEQDLMVKQIESFDMSARIEQEQLQKLELQKAGLMHDLLTGRVPVPLPEPEALAADA
jgi:type I restriction enzyme S subunit